jgi:hypothetical protein
MPAPFRNRDVNHLFTPEPSSWSKQAFAHEQHSGANSGESEKQHGVRFMGLAKFFIF